MGTEQDLRRIAQLAAEAADIAAGVAANRAVRGGAAGLAPLLKEMQALGEVLPGLPRKAAVRIAREAEIEAGFDNMPV